MTWNTVVTFEYDNGEPECFRGEIVDSEPDSATRKAVFRALSQKPRTKYHSIVVVLGRK